MQGDILEDIALIENLEETKRTAVDIAEKVKQAKETELSIGKAREVYRTVATRGSLVYFLIDTLNALDRCYHYSMANFVYILRKGEQQPRIPDCVLFLVLTWLLSQLHYCSVHKVFVHSCKSRISVAQCQYDADLKSAQQYDIRTQNVSLVSVKYSISTIQQLCLPP